MNIDKKIKFIVNTVFYAFIICMILITLLAVAIIVIVMSMESNADGGTNVISGQSDSFYAKNQGSSKEGRLKKAIIICSIAIAVLAVLFWVTWAITKGYAA